jgi:hypothetical protein
VSTDIHAEGKALASHISHVTATARNEEQLRHEIEKALEATCDRLDITWTPFQLERMLRRQRGASVRFADVTHGAVVIEYEPPNSFSGKEGTRLLHARSQAEEYTDLLQTEEGRPMGEYVLVSWDGAHIDFGRHDGTAYVWDGLQTFDAFAAQRLLGHMRDNGTPLVHPLLLSERAGPTSGIGQALLPALFVALQDAVASRATNKTELLFTEWRRLFGQVVGDPSDRLRKHLTEIGNAHGQDYLSDAPAYLFALNTYIALVAKLVAALALPNASEDVSNPSVSIASRIRQLEFGQLFLESGITNMLNGDFFSWYVDDAQWDSFEDPLHDLINTLRGINFDVTRKTAESTRDLFKGLYMTFAPPALRHALGEYYTPDWLASHALDTIDWKPEQSLLDPTCGSGTFVLEALRRRLLADEFKNSTAEQLLAGLHGLDLNPLAVLAARASLVVFVSQRLDPEKPIQVPIYLSDAVNPATAKRSVYEHRLQTERGDRTFRLPANLVEHQSYFQIMQDLRELIDAGQDVDAIIEVIADEEPISSLRDTDSEVLRQSIEMLVHLHDQRWNGIWCSILADRFAAGAIPRVNAVVGNPPWVKWSNLPAEYADFIKPLCVELGIFSTDTWVGGIESDISTVITYKAMAKYCAKGGVLALFITGTVFSNESSQGFRRWSIQQNALNANSGPEPLQVERVEDYTAVAPFEGVKNHPTLLVLRRAGLPTRYPILYKVWSPPTDIAGTKRSFASSGEFAAEATAMDLFARPVPGSDSGPWLKGTRDQHETWDRLFGVATEQAFIARKGITTDANGIYFVKVQRANAKGLVRVTNDPSLGRRAVPKRSAQIEDTHVFPLLRGAGISAFQATPDPHHCVVVPQRGMHGDVTLPTSAPKTYRFLKRFEDVLLTRGSYRLYQKNSSFWSLWSTGAYTFEPYKVVWKEMPGGRFQAAYVDSMVHPILGRRVVIPDHKVYFVPCKSEGEAAYLTGFLNAPVVAGGINAYASALSLGVSVVEYLGIPAYESSDKDHSALAALAKRLTKSKSPPTHAQWRELDEIVRSLIGIPIESLDSSP